MAASRLHRMLGHLSPAPEVLHGCSSMLGMGQPNYPIAAPLWLPPRAAATSAATSSARPASAVTVVYNDDGDTTSCLVPGRGAEMLREHMSWTFDRLPIDIYETLCVGLQLTS
jgi:hypothetical protein